MKHTLLKSSLLVIAMGLSLVSTGSIAQDSTLRNASPHFLEDGWDIRLGAALESVDGKFYQGVDNLDGFTVLVDINYNNGNFFFSTTEDDSLLFGYSLARDDNWVIDAVFGPKFYVDFAESDMFDDQLKHLGERDLDGQLGARFSWYGDTNRVSVALTRDVTGAHDGLVASVDYQQEWQIKNWLITGHTGLTIFSEKMANHIAGVSADEATIAFPEYNTEGGQALTLEITAEYPVNENWIFLTEVQLVQFSSGFDDSPIIDDDQFTVVTAGFKHQF